VLLAAVGSVASGIYLAKRSGSPVEPQNRSSEHHSPEHRPVSPEVVVDHGGAVQPEELHGHGRLYFVPMGRQAIPAQSLADYYRQKFKIEITVLPGVAVEHSSCVPERRQCIAEEMIIQARYAYPQIARVPDSVMIILTDEDIYPRSFGWDFTYSFHTGYSIGIVSSRRMDPTFWGDPADPAQRLASTKQMLTKYIALMYFHVPASYDPSSVMYQPQTPNGGSDDIYESDIHSEESANGFRGSGWPCLSFTYSYASDKLKPFSPSAADCNLFPQVRSTDEETFQIELHSGQFIERSMDFQIGSVPLIEFRRAYLSGYVAPMAFGFGANHTYNTWLYSDGTANLTFMDIIREDGSRDHLDRLTPGRGFSSDVVFESHDGAEESYGSRMTWDAGHFKLQLRDGAWSTFLPCTDGRCYWNSYQDAKGNALHFTRGPHLELERLSSQDNQGIEFHSDTQQRIVDAVATEGSHVSYTYGDDGCLAEVHRADGRVMLYTCDAGHRMTSVSIRQSAGAHARRILTNEYDAAGHLIRQTLADGSVYEIKYGPFTNEHAANVNLKEPSGRILHLRLYESGYEARTDSIKYPARGSKP
jgi:YD repeat-containing protein